MISFTHAQHLGLYTAFHRSPFNRWLHVGTLGGVFFSAMCLLALVPFGDGVLAHGGTVLMVLLSVTMARLHFGASVWMLAIGLFGCALAGGLAQQLPVQVLAPAATLVHLVAWWVSVKVAHEHVEPLVQTPEGWVDTNVYFERGYFYGENLGVTLGWLDRWTQFGISALSTAWDLAEALGVQNPDQPEIDRVRADVLEALRTGALPFVTTRPTARGCHAPAAHG